LKLSDNFEVDLKLAIDDIADVIKILWNDVNFLKFEIKDLKEKLNNKQ